jgi:hypothetical protein
MNLSLSTANHDIKKLQKDFDKVNSGKLLLAQKLQPFVDFDIYVSIFEADGVCVMHGGKNVGMSASLFIKLLSDGQISESIFLDNSYY